jgi:signal peptidase I
MRALPIATVADRGARGCYGSPVSRTLAVLVALLLPGQGLLMLGRPRLALADTVLWALSVLALPFAQLWALVAWLVAWLGGALATAVLPRGAPVDGATAWIGFAGRVAVFLGLALVARGMWVEGFKIPAGSMLPTLQVGDHVFVSKFDYGVRLWPSDVVVARRSPERGDVIVFEYPKDRRLDFVKRVVAVSGDEVEVRAGHVLVNGRDLRSAAPPRPCGWSDWAEYLGRWSEHRAQCFVEASGAAHWEVAFEEEAELGDFGPVTVPQDHVFVLGDNRANSHDSRFWGPVPLDHVKGRVRFVWWSRGPHGARWDRLGARIR